MGMFNAFKLQLGRMQPQAHVSYLDLPTLIIHWVHVQVASWLRCQYEHPGLTDLLDMGELFTCIKMNDPSWIPLMLACLLPSIQLGIRPSASIVLALSLASGATATSMLTPATALNPGTTVGIWINNLTHDPTFDQFHTCKSAKAQAVQKKAAKSNTALPNHPDGCPICLTYHIKGMCNTNCAQTHDHVAWTPAENQALLAWCHLHWST